MKCYDELRGRQVNLVFWMFRMNICGDKLSHFEKYFVVLDKKKLRMLLKISENVYKFLIDLLST